MTRRLLLATFIGLLATLLGTASPASAHSGIQSYVYMSVFDDALEGRVEYPVADLGEVLGIEFPDDADDALDLARTRATEIIDYTDRHLDLSDADGSWNVVFTGEILYLDTENGGYVLVPFDVDEPFDEIPRAWTATYDGIIESNPERDALFLIEDDWKTATFRNEGSHLLGFSVGNETQEIVLDEVSATSSLREIARLGTNTIDESAVAVLAVIAVLSAATVGRVRSETDDDVGTDPGATRPPVLTSLLRVAMHVVAVIVGQTVSLWVIGLAGIDVSERVAVLAAAVGVLVAAASRWLDDRASVSAAGAVGLLVGVLVGFEFVELLLERSRPVLSLLAFGGGASVMIVIVTLLLLPIALLLTRHRAAPQIANAVSIIGLVAGSVWAIERAFDLTFKLRNAELRAADAATSPIVVGIATVVVAWLVFGRAGTGSSTSDPAATTSLAGDATPSDAEPQTTEAP
ncbi:MAG: hypothetical protein AAF945_15485 [Actinomycetota bacterium]